MNRALVAVGIGRRLVLEAVARPDLVDPDASVRPRSRRAAGPSPARCGRPRPRSGRAGRSRRRARGCRAWPRCAGGAVSRWRASSSSRVWGSGAFASAVRLGRGHRNLRIEPSLSVPEPVRQGSMTASSWPRVTWSAGRTRRSADAPGDRGDHDVLHLHRLEGDDGVAGLDRVADRGVDAQDGAGHRGDDLGRAGRAGDPVRDGRARRGIDVGRRRRAGTTCSGRRDRGGRCRRRGRRRRHGARSPGRGSSATDRRRPSASSRDRARRVEPPAAGPWIRRRRRRRR